MSAYQGDGEDEGLVALLAPELDHDSSSEEEEEETDEEEEEEDVLPSPPSSGGVKRGSKRSSKRGAAPLAATTATNKSTSIHELEREVMLLASTLGTSMVNIVDHRMNMVGEGGRGQRKEGGGGEEDGVGVGDVE
jgi:hypothetical protein